MAKKKRGGRTTKKRASTTGRTGGRKNAKRSGSGPRQRISPRGDTRFVRRDARGRITESDDAGRSLAVDRRKKAKKKVRSGYGDKGDR